MVKMKELYLTKHKPGKWYFDTDVAKNFDIIAEKNIPHYRVVIEKNLQIIRKIFPNNLDINIIDVGSATGNTVDILICNGYKNVYGVESSPFMKKYSSHKEKIILSENFPIRNCYDVVIANWTLHFVKNRYKYLKDIHKAINRNGYFILTEKVSSSAVVQEMYHDFKRQQGVPEDEIIRKSEAIKGVLVTRPLSWYLKSLEKIGFSKIEVIDADWCYVSLLCKK